MDTVNERLLKAFSERYTAECHQEGSSDKVNQSLMRCYWKLIIKKWLIRIVIVSVLICIVNRLYYNEGVKFFVLTHVRLLLLKSVLPYIGLKSSWQGEFCMLPNPIFVPPHVLQQHDCDICETNDQLLSVPTLSMEDYRFEFLDKSIPVLVQDGVPRDWIANHIGLHDLLAFYEDGSRVFDKPSCKIRHNLSPTLYTNALLLADILERSHSNWFAHWRHCDVDDIKEFRRYYYRPSFLPPSITTIGSSYVFLWDNYSGRVPKNIPIPPEKGQFYFAQINGTAEVILHPKPPCENVCHNISSLLRPGNILAFSNRYYTAKWLPSSMDRGFAIAFEGEAEGS